MSRLSKQASGVLFCAVLACVAASGSAQTKDVVIVRAIGPHIGTPLVRFVAQNAEAHPSERIAALLGAGATPRSVILRLCGSLRDDYYIEFRAQNGGTVPSSDETIGAAQFIWPACLAVDVPPGGVRDKVDQGETAGHVYTRLTGGGGAEERALENFFGRPIAELNSVRVGQVLVGKWSTRPVDLVPRGMSALQFLARMDRVARGADGRQVMFTHIADPAQGEIIALDESAKCSAVPGSPFDALSVIQAYEHMRSRAQVLPKTAQIAIVDNGFFGAHPDFRDDEFKDSPFAKAFFESDPSSIIKQRFDLDTGVIYPINYSNGYQPNIDSGHGTHVAGLVLGGPAFLPYRDSLITVNGKPVPWAKVTILNVGAGTRSLFRGAARQLQSMLPGTGGWIVNMSIAYAASDQNKIATTFRALFQNNRHLYVVAAGNKAEDVSAKVYPAGSGGVQTSNVITVASLDGDRRYSRFSNVGRDTVDMAAPGCQIESWLQNSHTKTRLSGTSQAAPQVAFAATLLRTLVGDANPRWLKTRIVTSGRLLHPDDQGFTAYRVGLDIPKALYWYDDYLRLAGDRAGEYLGEITMVSGLHCKTRRDAPTADMWAFKRDDKESWLYLGRDSENLRPPCDSATRDNALLRFKPSHRISADGVKKMSEAELKDSRWTDGIPLSDVETFVFRTPLTAD